MLATKLRPRFDIACDSDGVVGHAGAALLADGGDCLSDLGVLRTQPELFGEVACSAGQAG